MRTLTAAVSLGLASVAFSQVGALSFARSAVANGVLGSKVHALPNGNFLIVVPTEIALTRGPAKCYWMTRTGQVVASTVIRGTAANGSTYLHGGSSVDASGNAYVYGSDNGLGDDLVIYKFNESGAQLWRRTADVSAGGESVQTGTVDPFGNLLIGGMDGLNEAYIARFNPNGPRTLLIPVMSPSSISLFPVDLKVTRDGRIHFATSLPDIGPSDGQYWCYNGNGTFRQDTTLTGFTPRKLAVIDASSPAPVDRVFFAGYYDDMDGRRAAYRCYSSTNGSFIFGDDITPMLPGPPYGTEDELTDVVVDGSRNAIFVGRKLLDGGGGTEGLIVKVSDTGTVAFMFSNALQRNLDVEVDRWNRFVVLGSENEGASLERRVSLFRPDGGLLYTHETGFPQAYLPHQIGLNPITGDMIAAGSIAPGNLSHWQGYRQAPLAIADAFTATIGGVTNSPRAVTSNDRYAGGSTARIVTNPIKGTLSFNTTTHRFTYTGFPGQSGTDSFTYRLTKPGVTPSTTTVTLTLVP